MLGILSTGWSRLGTGDHWEDNGQSQTPVGQAGVRVETCPEGPLLENEKLGHLQTWTHHLGAANSVKSARDSASATCPDVVLKLTGLESTPLRLCSGHSPLRPRPGQSPSKGPWTHPTGFCTLRPDKAQQGAPKAAVHTRAHAHSHSHAYVQTRPRVCLKPAQAEDISDHSRSLYSPHRPPSPRKQPCRLPPTAGLWPRGSKAGGELAGVAQLCLTLCDPMDCSLPGSPVHEILQARILEWDAMPSSREQTTPQYKKNLGGMLVKLKAEKLLATFTRRASPPETSRDTVLTACAARPEGPRLAGRVGTGPLPAWEGPEPPRAQKAPTTQSSPWSTVTAQHSYKQVFSTERPQTLKRREDKWTLSDAPRLPPQKQATGLSSSPQSWRAGETAGHTGQIPTQLAGT